LSPRRGATGSILTAGLQATAFTTTALATIIYHFSPASDPDTLAAHIALSAPGRFLEKPDPEAYQEYAIRLKRTLVTQFDMKARATIFGQYASTAERLLSE
jgi:hypothetical protein